MDLKDLEERVVEAIKRKAKILRSAKIASEPILENELICCVLWEFQKIEEEEEKNDGI